MKDPKWLRFDERVNSVDSLIQASRFIVEMNYPLRWKWVVLSIQHAVYMFCTNAVAGTDYSRVLKPITCSNCKKKSTLDDIRDNSWKCPKCSTDLVNIARKKLLDFNQILSKLKNEVQLKKKINKKLVSFTSADLDELRWLHSSVRNEIQHFVPTLIVIPVKRIKKSIALALYLIEFLVFESGLIQLTKRDRQSIMKSIQVCRIFI